MSRLRILRGDNPYARQVQGKANEPITVAALLDRARRALGLGHRELEYSLEEIYDRLEYNAPRVAIIGGSPDHPAHIMDLETVYKAAVRIWQRGGVPFSFSVPVLCDGTAQSTLGMCYSLQSRNAIMQMVANQMEAQSYHGAFVIQGCDKHPTAVLSALAQIDVIRRERGDAPVFASFAPAHVLRGGTIPPDLRADLESVAQRAESAGHADIAEDLRDTMAYILQCSSDQAFLGVLVRAENAGIIGEGERKDLIKLLSVNTCHSLGGICAFNGTGNSSRHIMSALGLAHPELELLTEPPSQERVNHAIDALLGYCNDPDYSVSNMIRRNIENAVRIHSTTGGSTNLMLHLVAVAICAGMQFDIWTYDSIRRQHPIPDLFDYSLTQGRSIFELAEQCCNGLIRGIETVFYELLRNGVPMSLDAPTATGTTWRRRLENRERLAADNVKVNPIILSKPRRQISGIDVLEGNFFESAVVKISGLSDEALDAFDEKVCFVLYYENEDEANRELLDPNLLDNLRRGRAFAHDAILAAYRHSASDKHAPYSEATAWDYDRLFDYMVRQQLLKIAIVISGQGPEAFGMPEMFTPMQYINSNRQLRRIAMLLSDGRYSGVTWGAAVGHITPEAKKGGWILYLQTGDLLWVRLRQRKILLLEREAFCARNELRAYSADLSLERRKLGAERLERIELRARLIAPANRMIDHTDAAHGVLPRIVAQIAQEPYKPNPCSLLEEAPPAAASLKA